jgi:hypothetical protein
VRSDNLDRTEQEFCYCEIKSRIILCNEALVVSGQQLRGTLVECAPRKPAGQHGGYSKGRSEYATAFQLRVLFQKERERLYDMLMCSDFIIICNKVPWRIFEYIRDGLRVIKKIASGGACMICILLLLVSEPSFLGIFVIIA